MQPTFPLKAHKRQEPSILISFYHRARTLNPHIVFTTCSQSIVFPTFLLVSRFCIFKPPITLLCLNDLKASQNPTQKLHLQTSYSPTLEDLYHFIEKTNLHLQYHMELHLFSIYLTRLAFNMDKSSKVLVLWLGEILQERNLKD